MNILDARASQMGWDETTGILEKQKVEHQPICHCRPALRNRLGGMQPAIDREASVIRCRTCLKVIGPGCRTRQVMHLRGLLLQLQSRPEMIDLEDCQDAGFLL